MSSAIPHLLHPLPIKEYRPKMPTLGRYVGQTFVGFRTIEQEQGVDIAGVGMDKSVLKSAPYS